MNQKSIYTIILAIYVVAMLILTTLPQVAENEIVSRYDKYFHLMEFFLFTLILYRTLQVYNAPHPYLITIFIAISLALTTEVLQLIAPLRNFSVRDIAFNLTGVAMALIAKWI